MCVRVVIITVPRRPGNEQLCENASTQLEKHNDEMIRSHAVFVGSTARTKILTMRRESKGRSPDNSPSLGTRSLVRRSVSFAPAVAGKG